MCFNAHGDLVVNFYSFVVANGYISQLYKLHLNLFLWQRFLPFLAFLSGDNLPLEKRSCLSYVTRGKRV